jgi:hypothetical protein
MQNKPNSQNEKMFVTKVSTKDYENETLGERPETNPNKPNQTQFKPNTNPICKMHKMNASFCLTKEYAKIARMAPQKQTQFKANSKPIFIPQNPLIVYNASKFQNACLEGQIYAEQNH